MRTRTKTLFGVLLGLALALGLLPGTSLTAYAGEATESFTTTGSGDCIGTHFKISGTNGDSDGFAVGNYRGNGGNTVTVSSLNGENITKIEATVGYVASSGRTVNANPGTLSGNCDSVGSTITVTNINATSVTFTQPVDNHLVQLNSWTIYYEETTTYPLWVGGTQVTSANAKDVFGDGKVSYTPATTGDNPTPATLTLNGYDNEGKVYNWGDEPENPDHSAAIHAGQDLAINLSGSNTVTGSTEQTFNYGIHTTGKLTIAGDGKMTVTAGDSAIRAEGDGANVSVEGGEVEATAQSYYGIQSNGGVTIGGGSVTASGGYGGIYASADLTIKEGTVTATGDPSRSFSGGIICDNHNIIVSGGDVTATGGGVGISCQNMAVSDGSVTATGSDNSGVYAYEAATISGGTVKAEGQSYGIYTEKKLTISSGTVSASGKHGVSTKECLVGSGVTSFTASGSNMAVDGYVWNDVAGTGWTDAEGTQGKAAIDKSAEGQDLNEYRKVQFPAVPTYTVTYRVVNGTWSDGSVADITEDVDGGSKPAKVPTGMKASEGYAGGAWDTNPADVAITEAALYTYTFTTQPTPAPAKVGKPSTSGHPAAGTLDVSWKAAKDAKSYEVQWRKRGGKWQKKVTKSRKLTVSGLKKGTLYEVRVRAKADSVVGEWSSVARRWLRGPSGVKAKAGAESGTIKVSWKRDKKANAGFKAYVYAKKGGKFVKTVKADAGATSATVSGLKAGKRYYVRVRPIRTSSNKTYTGTLSGYRAVRAAK